MTNIEKYIKDEGKYQLKSTITENSYFIVQKVQKIETQDDFIKKIFKIDGTKSIFDHNKEIAFLIKMQNTPMPFAILESLSLPSSSNNNFYIMTKYMENRDLKTIINSLTMPAHDLLTSWDKSVNRQNPDLEEPKLPSLDDTQKTKIIYGIAFGLNHMHKNGIVHGNIRPSNILLSDQCEPLITDFIYTKDIISNKEFQEKCNNEQLVYMAPENLFDGKQLDYKSDAYSFAVLVLHLLTINITFKIRRYDPFSVKPRVLKDFIKSEEIYNVPESIPKPLYDIIKQNLSRNPDDRGSIESYLNYFNDPQSPILFPNCDQQIFREYVDKLNSAL